VVRNLGAGRPYLYANGSRPDSGGTCMTMSYSEGAPDERERDNTGTVKGATDDVR